MTKLVTGFLRRLTPSLANLPSLRLPPSTSREHASHELEVAKSRLAEIERKEAALHTSAHARPPVQQTH